MSPEEAVVTQTNSNSNSDNISVENVAEEDYEVHLHDLAISAEDIKAMRRIEARIAKAQKTNQAAPATGPSDQVITRVKGKDLALSKAEKKEQYKRLREEELRC